MRKLETLNYFEIETLKVLINNYKVFKRTQDDLQYIFGLSIYTLLNIQHEPKKPVWLKDLLTDEFITNINQLSKTVNK